MPHGRSEPDADGADGRAWAWVGAVSEGGSVPEGTYLSGECHCAAGAVVGPGGCILVRGGADTGLDLTARGGCGLTTPRGGCGFASDDGSVDAACERWMWI